MAALTTTQERKLFTTIRFLALLTCLVIFFLPIVSMVLTALKTNQELFQVPPRVLPQVPQWHNIVEAWVRLPYEKYLVNSVILSLFYTVPVIFGSAFAGYGFSRFKVKESRALFVVVLATIMVPLMVKLMPLFLIASEIGMTNKRWLWILWGLQGQPFLIFLFRQYFSTIPLSFEESARMDGASNIRIFFSIMFPLVQTAVIIALVFAVHWSWSNYLMPILFLSEGKANLAVQLATAYSDVKDNLLFNLQMGGTLLYTLPILILFFVLQRRFIAGMLSGGLKG